MQLIGQRATKVSEFAVTPEIRSAEIERVKDRNLSLDRLFVLLLGPSATGKSTIIEHLNRASALNQFVYVKPIMTRPNRPGETDKISVSSDEFDALEESGKFVVVNDLYTVRYGTPIEGILEPLRNGQTPILDYPIDTVTKLERDEYDTLKFYIYPGSVDEWSQRMEASGRNIDGRLERGLRELGSLAIGAENPLIDISIVNSDGRAEQAAREILTVINEVVN